MLLSPLIFYHDILVSLKNLDYLSRISNFYDEFQVLSNNLKFISMIPNFRQVNFYQDFYHEYGFFTKKYFGRKARILINTFKNFDKKSR